MGNQVSAWRKQLNGLPQGSVLSPTLFNLYTNDLPMTVSRKFVYADDICFASQGQSFSELKSGLNSDIASISDYCVQWRLTPSVTKTVSSMFHLDNRRASKELNIYINGCRINHDPCPVYLGVSLDRSLTFRHHATKTAAKIKSRKNIIAKLAGTSWGANAQTLRSSAVALCYSVAEYCVPAWGCSSHTKLVCNLMKPCESPLGLYNQLHSSGYQFCQTLLLQLSDVPRQLLSSFKTYRPSHTFLFTRTSSITRRLICSPVDQYGP